MSVIGENNKGVINKGLINKGLGMLLCCYVAAVCCFMRLESG